MSDARTKLKAVGKKRQRVKNMQRELQDETRKAMEQARREEVPITEAARLAGLHRGTVYELYTPPNS
jgi:DNA-directed RNA polymerase specialized sigma24 family protein